MSLLPTVRRLLPYARRQRALLAGGVVAALLNAAGAAAYAQLVGPVLGTLLSGGSASMDAGPVPLRLLPVALVAVAAVKGLSALASAALLLSAGQRTIEGLRRDLFGHLLRLPPAFFAAHHRGELFSRLTNDVAQVEFGVSQAVSSYVKDTLQIVALLAVCAWLDLRLFALAFVALPLAAFPVSLFARRARNAARGTQASMGQLTALLSEQLHALPVVQAFRAEARALERYDGVERDYLAAMRRSLFVRGAFTPVLELIGITGLAAAIAVGTAEVARTPELGPKVLSFLTAALLLYPPLKSLSGTGALALQSTAAAERLFELRDAPLPPDGAETAPALTEGLRVEDLWVRYPDGREGLRGARFQLRAGEQVALVGPSGAGKSTTLATLLGLVAPARGEVLWNGIPTERFRTASLRAQIGWVPQEPSLLDGSVRDNLLFARPDADDSALWEALRRAHAEAWVRSLPQGLDTPVGERGGQLSGGQRQRIAIARAFLRAPSLLLLDEPTRALDALSEREVQAGLEELRHGRTTLVVAHRLSTVENADRILVLEDGRVVEEGSHAALVAARGRYAQLLGTGALGLDGDSAGS